VGGRQRQLSRRRAYRNKKWPYGSAWGRYHYYGKPSGSQEKIKVAGTYAWMFLMPDDPAHPKE